MSYTAFRNKIKLNKFELCKAEVLKSGPSERQIDNVFIKFNENEKKISLQSSQKNKLLLTNILNVILCDLCWQDLDKTILYFGINNQEIMDRDYQTLIEKTLKIEDDCLIVDIIVINNIFYYEEGCCIYKMIPGYPDDYFLDKELKNWEDSK